MAQKNKTVYICRSCGYESGKWYGKCPGCGEWDSLLEEVKEILPASKAVSGNTKALRAFSMDEIGEIAEQRYSTGLKELNRVLGGGIVRGSLVLLSGDPGIGKSTILLQICEKLGSELDVLYVSGEESPHQIKLRANRLGVTTQNLLIMSETDVQSVAEFIRQRNPGLVIVDSIQTMNHSDLSSSTGSVTQVRECTNLLMRTAKTLNIPIIIVGHVNKDGAIAGPKVLEHIVDTVLYFEGERNLSYRILRAVKNRFGSTNEIGIFEMKESGLCEVENPSMMLLSGRPKNTSGTCVACVMEGSRPILAEVQGLATATGFGTPRRVATGFDYNRMAMLIAVLEKRAGYFFSNMDAYVNIIGGLRLEEPAADLSVSVALISSLKDVVVPEKILAFGEIGLAGEIRSVSHCESRILEASRLGFESCVIPKQNYRLLAANVKTKIQIFGAGTVREAFEALVK